MTMASANPSKHAHAHSHGASAATRYLIGYNAVSALLWFSLLARVAIVSVLGGYGYVYEEAGPFARWIQTLALLEVAHSATGLVRAPLFTTLMQVASRLFVVYPVLALHPQVAQTPAVVSLYLAWAVTEVIRYGYFTANLRGGSPPQLLVWLRYNMFFVLYPVGIASECLLTWRASQAEPREWGVWALWAVLGIYVPGAYVLYSHMMTQRRRVIKGKAVVKQGQRGRVPTI